MRKIRTRTLALSFGDIPEVTKSAVLDETEIYRYSLCRIWNASKERVLFVMLNPSTADAEIDDPTIKRCIGLAKSWGYGAIEVVNLYAYRSTDPDAMIDATLIRKVNIVGPDNDRHIREALTRSSLVVAAWGTHKAVLARNATVLDILGTTHAIRVTKDGHPGHPLYVPSNSTVNGYTVRTGTHSFKFCDGN